MADATGTSNALEPDQNSNSGALGFGVECETQGIGDLLVAVTSQTRYPASPGFLLEDRLDVRSLVIPGAYGNQSRGARSNYSLQTTMWILLTTWF